jgi:hypothetical protein
MIKSWTLNSKSFLTIALTVTLSSTILPAIAPVSIAAGKANAPKSAAKAAEDARSAAESLDAPSDAPFWVPAARLATDKPQRIQLNNKTGVPLEYLITTHTDFRVLAPNQSVTLTNFTPPIFLNINPQESNYLVVYKVSVNAKTNTLIVNISRTNQPDNRSLHLDETGAVYLY